MDKNKLADFIKNELHLEINEDILDSFDLFESLLIEWNEKFNLTAIKEKEEILEKHFIDSIYLNKFVSFKKHDTVLDIGSGAGFPAIALAIINTDVNFTLVESNGKKVSFLNEVRNKLQLKNVTILNGRIEDLKVLRSSFDYVTARAVTQLNILVELSIPYLKVNGTLIAYKGSMVDIEIKQANRAIHSLDSKFVKKEVFNLPYSNDGRSFVFIKKCKETKNKYPRSYSLIVNKPL